MSRLLLPLALLGCLSPEPQPLIPSDDPLTDVTVVTSVPTATPLTPATLPDCGGNAIDLRNSDAHTVTDVPLSFVYDGASGVRVSDETFVFALPEDLVSFALTTELRDGYTGLAWLHYQDQTWIDAELFDGTGAWDTAPYFHWGVPGGTLVAPITPGAFPGGTDPAGGGCLEVRAAALDDEDIGTIGTLHLVTRRGATEASTLDLNIVLVGDTVINGPQIQAALDQVESIWTSGGGPTVGAVQFYSLPGESLVAYDDSAELRSTLIDAARGRAVNIFIIQDYLDEPGTLGEAGGIPGPIGLQQVDEAGVIVAVDGHADGNGTLLPSFLGETLAHEVGHQLGLFHTTEDDGSRSESLADTPACPASADVDGDDYFSAEECAAFDGTNFMFWVSGDLLQTDVSDDQAFVLSRSPVATSTTR